MMRYITVVEIDLLKCLNSDDYCKYMLESGHKNYNFMNPNKYGQR